MSADDGHALWNIALTFLAIVVVFGLLIALALLVFAWRGFDSTTPRQRERDATLAPSVDSIVRDFAPAPGFRVVTRATLVHQVIRFPDGAIVEEFADEALARCVREQLELGRMRARRDSGS
jgi:hypothetical protein